MNFLLCPKCHQKLVIDEENLKMKCCNPLCDFDSSDPIKVPDLMTYRQFDYLDYLETHRPDVPRDVFSGQFPQIPGFYPISHELNEEERKFLYWGSVIVSSIIIIGFLAVSATFWKIPWQTLIFSFLLWAFLISRGADLLTTFISLSIGGIETNPFSDPHDISKFLRVHGFQILFVLVLGYFLGQWNSWLGNGLLLWATIMGFRAALSNITDIFIFRIIFLPTSGEVRKALFYINTVVCSIVICVIAYFAFLYFLSGEFSLF
jgi:hypothetical protein